MIGLSILAVALLWTCFTIYLTVKIPRWLRLKSPINWLVRLFLVPAMLMGPFAEHRLGMRQFEQLCREKAVLRVFPNADQVKRAKASHSDLSELRGYWIDISASKSEYIDIDTGNVFMTWDNFHTTGGYFGRFEVLGLGRWCQNERHEQFELLEKRIDLQLLLDNGYQKS